MAFIVYQTNKKTGTVYAYRQEAYRDPVTKRPKSKKTYLGRVDPVTKQIVEKIRKENETAKSSEWIQFLWNNGQIKPMS